MTNKKDEWGNISLPGVDDKKLFETNWTHLAAVRERNQVPGYEEKRLRELYRVMATDAWLQKVRDTAKQWSTDPDWYADQLQRIEQRSHNKAWRKNVGNASVITHGRCCVVPWGVFPSVQQAGLFRDKERGTKCGVTVTCRNLQKGTPGYRYIDREEYIMLTGKDVT